MPDETHKVDMARYAAPYVRGPQVRKNLEAEFARRFPDRQVAATGEGRYEEIERILRGEEGGAR